MISVFHGSMRGNRKRRRAFIATVTAVTLMGLASVAFTAIVAATIADVRRTRQLESDAQLRQLLLAGAADAAARAKTWGDTPEPASWELALPQELAERGFRVHLVTTMPEPASKPDTVEVRVQADGAMTGRSEVLRFTRTAGRWSS